MVSSPSRSRGFLQFRLVLLVCLSIVVGLAIGGTASAGLIWEGGYEGEALSPGPPIHWEFLTTWDGIQPNEGASDAPGSFLAGGVSMLPRQGSQVGRFVVREGDVVGSGERAEVQLDRSPPRHPVPAQSEGVESWYAWSTLFPESNPQAKDNFNPQNSPNNLFTQWHHLSPALPAGTYVLTGGASVTYPSPEGGDCSGNIEFTIDTTNIYNGPGIYFLARGGALPNPATIGQVAGKGCISADTPPFGHRIKLSGPPVRNQWYDFVFHVKWSSDPQVGFAEIWVNGVRVLPKTMMPTLYSYNFVSGPVTPVQRIFPKQGYYRPGKPAEQEIGRGTTTIIHDAMRLGQSFFDVACSLDFEYPANACWSGHQAATLDPVASDMSRSGRYSLKLVSSQPSGSDARAVTQLQAFPVKPGDAIQVCGFLKTQGVTNGYARLAVTFWDASEAYRAGSAVESSPLIGGTAVDWSQTCLAAIAPPGAAFMRVEFRLGGPGTLWADDVVVSAVVPPPLAPVSIVAPQAFSGSLWPGGTVQTNRGTWTDAPTSFDYQWFVCTDSLSPASCASLAPPGGDDNRLVDAAQFGKWIRSRVRATGLGGTGVAFSNALGPVASQPGGNLALDGPVDNEPSGRYFPNGPCTFSWADDQWRSSPSQPRSLKIVSATSDLCRWLTRTDSIPAIPGQVYDVCVYAKTQAVAGRTFLSVNFWTAGVSYIPATVDSPLQLSGSQDWTQLCRLHVTAPPGAAFLRVEFRLEGPGTVWLDDVSVFTSN